MDKELIEDMKHEAEFQFRLQKEQVRYDAPVMLQAIQAYAALCQAEAMERIDSPQVTVGKSLHTHLFVPDDNLNRADQSIADALAERGRRVNCGVCGTLREDDDAALRCARSHATEAIRCGLCGKEHEHEGLADECERGHL